MGKAEDYFNRSRTYAAAAEVAADASQKLALLRDGAALGTFGLGCGQVSGAA